MFDSPLQKSEDSILQAFESKEFLQTTTIESISKCILWSRIAGLLSLGNIVLGLLQIALGFIKGNSNSTSGFISFLVSALFSLLISFNLLRFSSLLKKGVMSKNDKMIQLCFSHIRIFFLTMGFLFIIALALLQIGLLIILFSSILK